MQHPNSSQSVLESAAAPLPPRELLSRLSGCAPYCGGRYADVLSAVQPRLVWTGAKRLALTAATYADPGARRAKLTEYVWTEYYGGVFIEDFLRQHNSEHEKLLRRHAADEVRHGNTFATYARLPAPVRDGAPECALSRDTYAAYLEWINGDFTAFISILHVLELRTAIILTHWFYLLAAYPDSDHDIIQPMLARIARDEAFHLTYTLQILVGLLDSDDAVTTLTEAFLLSEASVPDIIEASQRRRNLAGATG